MCTVWMQRGHQSEQAINTWPITGNRSLGECVRVADNGACLCSSTKALSGKLWRSPQQRSTLFSRACPIQLHSGTILAFLKAGINGAYGYLSKFFSVSTLNRATACAASRTSTLELVQRRQGRSSTQNLNMSILLHTLIAGTQSCQTRLSAKG
jgi:hypothetical protein